MLMRLRSPWSKTRWWLCCFCRWPHYPQLLVWQFPETISDISFGEHGVEDRDNQKGLHHYNLLRRRCHNRYLEFDTRSFIHMDRLVAMLWSLATSIWHLPGARRNVCLPCLFCSFWNAADSLKIPSVNLAVAWMNINRRMALTCFFLEWHWSRRKPRP